MRRNSRYYNRMDPVAIVAEHKIQTAIEEGAFDHLPQRDRIDCSPQGERFYIWWWREKLQREEKRLRLGA
jgi:hypothetical protein